MIQYAHFRSHYRFYLPLYCPCLHLYLLDETDGKATHILYECVLFDAIFVIITYNERVRIYRLRNIKSPLAPLPYNRPKTISVLVLLVFDTNTCARSMVRLYSISLPRHIFF